MLLLVLMTILECKMQQHSLILVVLAQVQDHPESASCPIHADEVDRAMDG